MQDDGNMGKIPRVYINTEEDNEECFLLVYRALGASICLLMKSKQSSNPSNLQSTWCQYMSAHEK